LLCCWGTSCTGGIRGCKICGPESPVAQHNVMPWVQGHAVTVSFASMPKL